MSNYKLTIQPYLQKQYISRVSPFLEKFSWTSESVCAFRCPICGDSKRRQNLRRGYIYESDNNWWYKCQNCGAAHTFTFFLKKYHRLLYNELLIDALRSTPRTSEPENVVPATTTAHLHKSNVDRAVIPISASEVAVQYVRSRGIPESKWSKLGFTSNFKKLISKIVENVGLDIGYTNGLLELPAIVIPFVVGGKIAYIQARYITGSFRYQTVKFDEGVTKCFGVDDISGEDVYVFEGPIKSLFVQNSIATADANLESALHYFDKRRLILVFDNEPRSPIAVKKIHHAIDAGFRVVIYPKHITQKDVDDMVNAGIPVNELISSWAVSGVRARLALAEWRKV